MKTLHLKAVPSNPNQQAAQEARPAPTLFIPRLVWSITHDEASCGWTIAPDGEFIEISRLVRS